MPASIAEREKRNKILWKIWIKKGSVENEANNGATKAYKRRGWWESRWPSQRWTTKENVGDKKRLKVVIIHMKVVNVNYGNHHLHSQTIVWSFSMLHKKCKWCDVKTWKKNWVRFTKLYCFSFLFSLSFSLEMWQLKTERAEFKRWWISIFNV